MPTVMEENDHQSASLWSSKQNLPSWGEDDREKGGGCAQNYTGEA